MGQPIYLLVRVPRDPSPIGARVKAFTTMQSFLISSASPLTPSCKSLYSVALARMWSENGRACNQPLTTLMKSNDAKKETKKAPQKTAKEKKLAKQEKKAKR